MATIPSETFITVIKDVENIFKLSKAMWDRLDDWGTNLGLGAGQIAADMRNKDVSDAVKVAELMLDQWKKQASGQDVKTMRGKLLKSEISAHTDKYIPLE